MSKPTNFSSTAFSTATDPLSPQQQPPTALSRRQFLTALGATLAGGALAYVNQGQANARAQSAITHSSGQVERPNIILIITDQERYPRHWPDGWVEANLPARQRLAQNGLSFRRSFCSTAMCSPSRSTLFTGLHPAQQGVVHTLTEGGAASPIEPTLPTAIQTMGKMVGSAGYNVVFKGKWHISEGDDGGDPTTVQVAAYGFNEWEPTAVCNDTKVKNFGGGCANWDQRITDQAANFLATQTAAGATDAPFMLVVGLGNPHDVLAYPNTWDQVEEGGCSNYTGFDFDQDVTLPASVTDTLGSKPTCQLQARNASQVVLGPSPHHKRWHAMPISMRVWSNRWTVMSAHCWMPSPPKYAKTPS
jgi:choline-sulfatase